MGGLFSWFAAPISWFAAPNPWDVAARARNWRLFGQVLVACTDHTAGMDCLCRLGAHITDDNCREILDSWDMYALADRPVPWYLDHGSLGGHTFNVLSAMAHNGEIKPKALRTFAIHANLYSLWNLSSPILSCSARDAIATAIADHMPPLVDHEDAVSWSLIGHGYTDLVLRRNSRHGTAPEAALLLMVKRAHNLSSGYEGHRSDVIERYLADSGIMRRGPYTEEPMLESYRTLLDNHWCLLASEVVSRVATDANTPSLLAMTYRTPSTGICSPMLYAVMSVVYERRRVHVDMAWLALARFKREFHAAFGNPDLESILRADFWVGTGLSRRDSGEGWRSLCRTSPRFELQLTLFGISHVFMTPGDFGDFVVRVVGGCWKPTLTPLWAVVYADKVAAVGQAVAALEARARGRADLCACPRRSLRIDDFADLVCGYL